MKLTFTLCCCLIASIMVSCSPTGNSGLFSKKTQREKYEDQVKAEAGKNDPVVNKWLNAGEYSLNHPIGITGMYSESGRFKKENQTATSFVTALKRGQKLSVQLRKSDTASFQVYMDLWHAADSSLNEKLSFIAAADTVNNFISYVAVKDEKLLVRFQQEIGAAGSYELHLQTGPSLYFPIAATVKSSIGSFWGDGRDGGARRHEGIDIFAPKHSPAVAVAEGTVTNVSENGIGGKVVSMRPKGSSYSIYYAHLDSQMVSEGQHVYPGDVLGLTGNTGNAKFTASHLHFGIYTYGGAIDPLLFVRPVKIVDKKIAVLPQRVTLMTTKTAKLLPDMSSADRFLNLPKNTALIAEASTGDFYRVVLPDGNRGFVAAASVKRS